MNTQLIRKVQEDARANVLEQLRQLYARTAEVQLQGISRRCFLHLLLDQAGENRPHKLSPSHPMICATFSVPHSNPPAYFAIRPSHLNARNVIAFKVTRSTCIVFPTPYVWGSCFAQPSSPPIRLYYTHARDRLQLEPSMPGAARVWCSIQRCAGTAVEWRVASVNAKVLLDHLQ
jgi:hypothetical protein